VSFINETAFTAIAKAVRLSSLHSFPFGMVSLLDVE